jgi:polar amino acid transport system substrate-binding protein
MKWKKKIAIGAAVGLGLAGMIGGLVACGSSPSPAGSNSSSPASASASVVADVKADPALNAALPSAIRSSGTLRVATDIPFPPWWMYVKVGGKEVTGIEYDLSQALAAKLGLRAQILQTPFDSIIPSLQAGKRDVAIATMFDNKEREKVLDFVDYGTDGYAILVAKGNPDNIRSFEDLSGKTVAVQSGTYQVQALQDFNHALSSQGQSPVKVVKLPKETDAQLAMISGKAQADVTDQSVANYTAKTFEDGNTFTAVNPASVPPAFANAILGIGIVKSDSQLVQAIQKALEELISDGTYHRIFDKYGVAPLEVKSAQVNQGGE